MGLASKGVGNGCAFSAVKCRCAGSRRTGGYALSHGAGSPADVGGRVHDHPGGVLPARLARAAVPLVCRPQHRHRLPIRDGPRLPARRPAARRGAPLGAPFRVRHALRRRLLGRSRHPGPAGSHSLIQRDLSGVQHRDLGRRPVLPVPVGLGLRRPDRAARHPFHAEHVPAWRTRVHLARRRHGRLPADRPDRGPPDRPQQCRFDPVAVRDRRHRRGARAGEAGGRSGQPGEVPVSRQHEPRDPHADQRHTGHDRAGPRLRARRGAEAPVADRAALGRDAARDHRRHPGLLQDRGRQVRAGIRRLRPARQDRRRGRVAGRARAAQGPEAERQCRCRRAGPVARRSGAALPGTQQPGEQRHQVHRPRRDCNHGPDRRAAAGRFAARPARAVRGQRHRHRPRSRTAVPGIRRLRAGGRIDHPQVRRHGTRPDHLEAAGRVARRRNGCRERARRRVELLVHDAFRIRERNLGSPSCLAGTGQSAPARPRAAGRGQPGEPGSRRRHAEGVRACGHERRERRAGAGRVRLCPPRPDPHGLPDAHSRRL